MDKQVIEDNVRAQLRFSIKELVAATDKGAVDYWNGYGIALEWVLTDVLKVKLKP